MTLYLSYNLSLNQESVIQSSWSNTEIPVLGVITDQKRIVFFQDEGMKMEEHSIIKDKQITNFCWHPFSFIIAYGFEDGRIGYWIDSESISKDDTPTAHEGKITKIRFSNFGNRVVSSDEKNNIIVWNFENGLNKLCMYQQKFEVEDLFFPNFNASKYKE